jgi:hypothetical protein
MTQEISSDDVQKPFQEASPEMRRIIQRILQAEKEKLYMKSPKYITDDLLKIFEEEIK